MRVIKLISPVLILVLLISQSPVFAGETYISGFLQGLYGGGTDSNNPTLSEMTASETRLQIRLESFSEAAELFGRLDFVYDDYNSPKQLLELREGYAKFKIGNNLDLKIGRQVITWGTGDLVFVNDQFAKDYLSFFNGRDDQYLKAPQNALRAEYYSGIGSFALVFTPRFTPNTIPSGARLSYFNPMVGDIVGGSDYLFEGRIPEAKLKNSEIAARYSKYLGSADLALYFYHGFYKKPVGMDMLNMIAYYPRLNVYGGSIRLPAFGGIAWLESGYFDSFDDSDGNDPTIPNSSISSIVGFERQIMSNLTANLQYQNRIMLQHDKYVVSLFPGMIEFDEMYHLVTSRITRLLFMETVTVSAFAFYSPSDKDFYGRFSASYKYTDNVTLTIGANIFEGADNYTDFGGFQRNDNVFFKITYGY